MGDLFKSGSCFEHTKPATVPWVACNGNTVVEANQRLEPVSHLSLFALSANCESALMQDSAPVLPEPSLCSDACVCMHMYAHECTTDARTHLCAEGLGCCERARACLQVPILSARRVCMRPCARSRACVRARAWYSAERICAAHHERPQQQLL